MSPQQQAAQKAADFVATFNEVILFPTIALLTAIAFLVFLWGGFEYLMNAGNDQGRQKGVKHITWGIIGLVVMVSAFAILNIIAATFGLNDELDCANDPSAGGCQEVYTLPEIQIDINGDGSAGGGTGGGNDGSGGTGGSNTGP